jgi:hypothetical protein
MLPNACPTVEPLEPRWAPARLTAGPLPPQFGVDLSHWAKAATHEELVSEQADASVGVLPVAFTEWTIIPYVLSFGESLASDLIKTSGGTLSLTGGSLNVGSPVTIYRGTLVAVPPSHLTVTADSLEGSSTVNADGSIRLFSASPLDGSIFYSPLTLAPAWSGSFTFANPGLISGVTVEFYSSSSLILKNPISLSGSGTTLSIAPSLTGVTTRYAQMGVTLAPVAIDVAPVAEAPADTTSQFIGINDNPL